MALKLTFFNLSVLFATTILLSGCGERHFLSPAKPGPVVVIFDRSSPGFQVRETQFQELDSLSKSAGEAGGLFDLWAYDSKPEHLWGPNPIPTVDMLDSVENNKLKHVENTSNRQSRPDLALQEFEKTSTSRALKGRICILTDGLITSPNPAASLRFALGDWAKHPGWRIAVLGITPQNTKLWRSASSAMDPGHVDLIDSKIAVSLLAQNRDE